MPTDKAAVDAYVKSLPDDRRAAVATLRKTILKHLPRGYEEVIAFGMLSYQVPLSVYPDTYNERPLMYAALGSQKSHMALYLCNAYGIPDLKQRLEAGFRAAGKRLDMGKACLRFKRLDDVDLGVIGEVVAATPLAAYVEFAKAAHSPESRAARTKARAASKEKATPAAAAKRRLKTRET